MMDVLRATDRLVFLWLNGWHSPFWDDFFLIITQIWWSVPLIFYWGFLIFKKYKFGLWKVLLFAGFLILATDQGSNIVKNSVKRYRPSHNLEISEIVHTVNNYKGGQYGFVSGHAANVFAIATFFFLLLRPSHLLHFLSFLIWASVISYSRIYLGVHYPADIICAAILGGGLAILAFQIFKKTQR